MPNYASVTIVGHLGKDPQTRQVASGDSVTSFSLATNHKRANQPDTVTWWRCSCWGKRGEAIARHLKQGDPILVTGEPLNRPWTDQDGAARLSLDVEVRDWAFVGGKGETRAIPPDYPPAASAGAPGDSFDPDSDIPF